MDKRSLVMYLSGLVAAGAVVGLAASCSDQPRIKCTAGHGAFAAVYKLTDGTPGCAPPGEQLGVEAYNYPLPDNSNVDPRHGSLGMASLDLVARADNHPPDMTAGHKLFSLGDWTSSEPGPDEFCVVNNPNPIEQDLQYVPAVPPGPDGGGAVPAFPSLNIKYEWNNVRFYNTPALPGTQLVADLTFTKNEGTADGGAGTPCTAKIRVVGLWPAVDCTDDEDDTKTDPTKCSPEPDNSKGRPTGSGINPDLKTKCDEALHLCVLLDEPK